MSLQQDRPIRVVVVDDSQLMRGIVARGLSQEGDIEVVATCANSQEARSSIRELDPDLVTLDVEMPGMNGIDFLKKIMELRPMPVVMVSTLTQQGTDTSIEALEIGAVEVVSKPASRQEFQVFQETLRKVVRSCAKSRRFRPRQDIRPGTVKPRRPASAVTFRANGAKLIAIGSSTGGVGALKTVLAGLPTSVPPVVVAQHMPGEFISRFAQRLNSQLKLNIRVAADGEELRKGHVYIAPGHAHLEAVSFNNALCARLSATPPVSGHRPSVDVLFESVSSAAEQSAIGVILTGMGKDGALGLKSMRQNGSLCLGQNEESCVVYGMPRAANEIGAVQEELPLEEIPKRICRFLNEYAVSKTA